MRHEEKEGAKGLRPSSVNESRGRRGGRSQRPESQHLEQQQPVELPALVEIFSVCASQHGSR